MLLIRSMAPKVISVDELGGSEKGYPGAEKGDLLWMLRVLLNHPCRFIGGGGKKAVRDEAG